MQDLPPPGGFAAINVERTQPKPLIRQGTLFVISVGITIFGLNYLREWRKRYRILRMEQQEHYIATVPFIYAEMERKFLINLYKMREQERELMKDHPGWVLGTLYGEKPFKTLPKDTLPPVVPFEYWRGRPWDEYVQKCLLPDWNK